MWGPVALARPGGRVTIEGAGNIPRVQEVKPMPGLVRRERREVEPRDVFDRLDEMFDDWSRLLPWRRPGLSSWEWEPGEFIRVDELREGDTLIVRAELPGVDPDKDVHVTVSDSMLHIEAERREEEQTERKGFVRRELRYGHLARSLPLPVGVTESDIHATYTDGILEITVQLPTGTEPTRIPIARS
jgi:HSP20 family protein